MRKSIIATALVAIMALPAISLAGGRFGGGGHDRGGRSSFNVSVGIGGGYRSGYSSSYYRSYGGYRGNDYCAPRYSYYAPQVYHAPAPPVYYSAPVYVPPPVYYTPGPVYYDNAPCYDSGDYVRFSYGYRR